MSPGHFLFNTVLNIAVAIILIFSIINADADASKWVLALQGAVIAWCVLDFIRDIFKFASRPVRRY